MMPQHIEPTDGGPIYFETTIDQYLTIIEPWNALSSLAFFIPVFYWIYKLKGQFSKYKLLTFILPFLFMNGLGSTLFHAFRNKPLFLYMDYVPMVVITFIMGFYFWKKAMKSTLYAILIFAGLNFVRYLVVYYSISTIGMNFSYFITGLLIFLPLIILMARLKFEKAYQIILTAFLLSLSLFFRVADNFDYGYFSMGVHWLWHLFSAMAVFPLGHYLIYLMDKKEI